MKKDKKERIKSIDEIFDKINEKPESLNIEEMIYLLESIIPVHVELVVTSFDEVDDLLALYPYLYQKLVKLFAYFIHKVREGRQSKAGKPYVDSMMGYRDCLEQIIKSVKLQYDALSRRITNNIERR